MEGDVTALRPVMLVRISTHALTWRATPVVVAADFIGPISTHALTWRATLLGESWVIVQLISTHALTWRATRACKDVERLI